MPRYDERSGPTRLYVGHLSRRTRSRDLEDLFAKYGRVRDVDMKHDFAFVDFSDSRDADDARHYLNGRTFDGNRIVVEFAKKGPRGSGGSRDYVGRGPIPGTGRCYNCGHDGHWARDCKAGDWKNKCYRCGERGHIERNCHNSPRVNRNTSRSRSRSLSGDRRRRRSRSRSRSHSYSPRRRSYSRSPRKDSSPAADQKPRSESRSRSRSPQRYLSRSPERSRSPSQRRSLSRSPRKSRSLSPLPNGQASRRSHSGSPVHSGQSPDRRSPHSPANNGQESPPVSVPDNARESVSPNPVQETSVAEHAPVQNGQSLSPSDGS